MHYNISRVAKSRGSCQTLVQLASYCHKTQNAFLNIMIDIITKRKLSLTKFNLTLFYVIILFCVMYILKFD